MLSPILLVEDDPRDRELTLIALERCRLANHGVVVRDGAEALDYLHARGYFASRKAGKPAVVLPDLKLPKVNGLEVLKQMQLSDGLRNIPTVMLAASNEEPDLKAAYRLGASAYVVKPVDFAEFVHAIGALGVFWAITNEQPGASLSPQDRRNLLSEQALSEIAMILWRGNAKPADGVCRQSIGRLLVRQQLPALSGPRGQ